MLNESMVFVCLCMRLRVVRRGQVERDRAGGATVRKESVRQRLGQGKCVAAGCLYSPVVS